MALKPGSKFGAYDVIAPIGAGGMGEVYRARDTELGRDVAIKVLPAAFADNPERLARFEREARTLAALNHPNIATIHGLETASAAGQPAMRALVMEFVEGDDLSVVLRRGALSLSEAVAIARQIAAGLEAAHDAGITHRDLKPANVKLRSDGAVKVLDFGLAKAPATDNSSDAMNSPTVTAQATAAGVILGTAAYMSPEQARGRPVDRRADIWAFGCVLFEMLSGNRPFAGEDVSETLAAVIKDEPSWNSLPANLPDPVRRLLRRCLEKDPRKRLSAIGDARLELDEPVAAVPHSGQVVAAAGAGRSGILWMAAGLLVATISTFGAWAGWFQGTPDAPPMRVTVLPPQGQSLFRDSVSVALSPDGRKVAFITGFTRQSTKLWIRSLDSLEARELEDSTGAQLPFWSPDSESVGFFAGGKLKIAKVSGGKPQVIADAPDGRGGAWSPKGDIVFAATNAAALSRVSENGGAVTPASVLNVAEKETGHRFPSFLPDGDHFLYAALPVKDQKYEIYVSSLSSMDRQRLVSANTSPVYAHPGFLVYARDGVLVAHAFDPGRRQLSGEAVRLNDTPGEINLEYSAGWAASASRTGAMAYLSAAANRSRLVWLDQAGRQIGLVDVPPGPHAGVALSRDGRRAILTEVQAPQSGLALVDLTRGGMTPLVDAKGWNASPIFFPDGRRFVYASDRDGPLDLYSRVIGEPQDKLLYKSADLFKYAASLSSDGKTIVFTVLNPQTSNDIWSIRPDDGKPPELVIRTPGNDISGTLSHDGKWLAYVSNKAGGFDVYVKGFPAGETDEYRITTNGTLDWGVWWKQDDSQLMILSADLKVLLVDIKTLPTFTASSPRAVGQLDFPINAIATIDATPDLSRMLAVVPEQADGARSVTVTLNWRKAAGK